jgi:hypothetical protein
MDLGEVGWGDMDWIGLAQDRNRWIPTKCSIFLYIPNYSLSLSLSYFKEIHGS